MNEYFGKAAQFFSGLVLDSTSNISTIEFKTLIYNHQYNGSKISPNDSFSVLEDGIEVLNQFNNKELHMLGGVGFLIPETLPDKMKMYSKKMFSDKRMILGDITDSVINKVKGDYSTFEDYKRIILAHSDFSEIKEKVVEKNKIDALNYIIQNMNPNKDNWTSIVKNLN